MTGLHSSAPAEHICCLCADAAGSAEPLSRTCTDRAPAGPKVTRLAMPAVLAPLRGAAAQKTGTAPPSTSPEQQGRAEIRTAEKSSADLESEEQVSTSVACTPLCNLLARVSGA